MEAISGTVGPAQADFIVHNPSDYRMIYGEAFAIEKWTGEVWENAELVAEASFLLIGYRLDSRETEIVTRRWDGFYGMLVPGVYRLVKEFSEDNPNIPWEQRRSIVLSAPFEVTAPQEESNAATDGWIFDIETLGFALQGTQSENIMLVSEVEVSQIAIAFSLENRSRVGYFYGEDWRIARYVDGYWQLVQYLNNTRLIHDIAYTLEGRSLQQYNINWARVYGALEPGRYLFLQSYIPTDVELPQANPPREYVMFEFIIDEDTPWRLP